MKNYRANANEIERFIVVKLAENLSVLPTEIDIKQTFSVYGVDSKNAVSLSGELCEFLGLDLPVTLLWDYPTIEKLTQALTAFVAN
jgi:acyl carrier protein